MMNLLRMRVTFLPVDNFGHFRFDPEQEVMPAFFSLVSRVVNPPQRSLGFLPAIARRCP